MANMFDVSAIQNYAVKNVNKIIGLIVLGFKAAEQLTVYQDVKEATGITTLKSGNLVQPYRLAFEPKANVMSFEYRKLIPQMGKVDLEIAPLAFRPTWLTQVMRPGVNAYDIPYPQFFFEQIAKKIAQEIDTQTVYGGVYNAAGASAVAVCDGLGKIISDEITATNLDNVVATGAITASNAVAKFRQMAKALPDAFRMIPMKMYCSYVMYDYYCENYQTTYGALPYNQRFEKVALDGFPMIMIEPATWLVGSGRILLTMMENLVMGTDLLSDMNNIDTVNQIRLLQLAIQFVLCFQIGTLDYLWVNDQA